MADAKLDQAIAALQAGNKLAAQRLLTELLKANVGNAAAWFWLAACLDDDQGKKFALGQALRLNPEDREARAALARLEPLPLPAQPDIAPVQPPAPATLEATPAGAASAEPPLPAPAPQSSRPLSWLGLAGDPIRAQWLILSALGVLALLVIVVTIILLVNASRQQPELPVRLPTPAPTRLAPPTVSATSPATVETVAAPPPTSDAPTPLAACASLTQSHLAALRPLVTQYNDAFNMIRTSSNIDLGSVITDMQRITGEVAAIPAPACAQDATSLIVHGMDSVNNALVDLMNSGSGTALGSKISQGLLDITNGTDQLAALAAGRATPTPRSLATVSPVATLLPSPTPAPAGSSIVVQDHDGTSWQILVTRVNVTGTIKPTFNNNVETAAGRFAILFMDITNRSQASATFVAYATLDLLDSTGQRSEESLIATVDAQDLYAADFCADVAPGQTEHCVVVYDISRQSDWYEFVPGALADPNGPRLLLAIP